MAAPMMCSPPPSWALPALDESFLPSVPRSSDSAAEEAAAMALRTERRLLALRRKMETGDHKYNRVFPSPSPSLGDSSPRQPTQALPSLPFSPMSAENAARSLQTPQATIEGSKPLKTPPTPGQKRRFLRAADKSGCPRFLPLGAVSQERQRRTAAAPSASLQNLGNVGKFNIAPRYESPWLGELAISAPPLASIEIKKAAAEPEVAKPEAAQAPESPKPVTSEAAKSSLIPSSPSRDSPLLDKLQAAARTVDVVAAAARPTSTSPPPGLVGSASQNRCPSPNRQPREAMARSKSLGTAGGGSGNDERLSRYSVRSLGLKPSYLSGGHPPQHQPKDLQLGKGASSKTNGLEMSLKPLQGAAADNFSGSPLASALSKSLSVDDKSAGAGVGKTGSSSVKLSMPNIAEKSKRTFRASSA
eukprot:CAMPEP_0197439174 /NCGR_PEP_ID=MMETSP1175-20131217/5982_1 /TAXON_ID=1003142 /ORGANISM="Triceratium dubium, Strain CCMP147" /LENGTH=416 /DNA_ID=CAMNT_0042969035 /DNA_START=73 /DNA_END=1323 /DNA_ORIENTATION=-